MLPNVNEISEKLESSALTAEVVGVTGDEADYGEPRESSVVTNTEQSSLATDDKSDEMSEVLDSVIASVVNSRPKFESALLKNNDGMADGRAKIIKPEPKERDPDRAAELATIDALKELLEEALKKELDSKEKSKAKASEPLPIPPKQCLYTTDPNMAPEANIFDSHCHLDRVFQASQRVDPDAFEKFIKSNYKNFGAKFEGCITVFCDPSRWDPVSACEAKCNYDDLSPRNLIAHSNINLMVITFHSRKTRS
jgi:hypothetical protein